VSLTVDRLARFRHDVISQFIWYAERENVELAERFQLAVSTALDRLAKNPELGPRVRLRNPRFAGLRYFRVEPPFDKHLIFYRVDAQFICAVRLIHGMRHVRRRLSEPV